MIKIRPEMTLVRLIRVCGDDAAFVDEVFYESAEEALSTLKTMKFWWEKEFAYNSSPDLQEKLNADYQLVYYNIEVS